ncbi:MAG: Plug domain-containing protein [Gemmatimonadota bacterium]|nr:Plug domain-containing protein [Gemmatimonadota bacterium]
MLQHHRWGRARLGLLAGAFFVGAPVAAGAQVVPPPGSEVPIPPKPATDSAAPQRDTIKARFGRSRDPVTADIGPQYSWDREELFASGALTVSDLLDRIPGALTLRSGWLASPKFVAVNGAVDRVRIFYDGLELDNLDARTAPLLDLNTVQLWTLERVSVERLGGELRVHLRSWQTERTVPYTRVDVSTGDEDSNLYRGYYGKRFQNGAGVQFGGQQFNTNSARFGGGGDGLSLLARVGTGGTQWSVDALAIRATRTRVVQPTFGAGQSVPGYNATQTLAYLRAAWGQIENGPWVEALASVNRLQEDSRHVTAATAATLRIIPDSADTTSRVQQYVLSGGFTRGPARLSAVHRVRSRDGVTTHSPSGRFELDWRYALVSVFAERDGFHGANRADVAARLTPVPFAAITGAITRTTDTGDESTRGPDITAARIEAGVRVFRTWMSAGFMTRDTALLPPLRVFDTAYVATSAGLRSGTYLAIRGPIIGALGADIIATRWAASDAYRPLQHMRAELNFITRWLSRFPSGNFGIHAAVIHEYRGITRFPITQGTRTTASSNVFMGLLEIRILRGIISYQVRNIAGLLHQVVPDFYMHRALNLYGVRWEFWN